MRSQKPLKSLFLDWRVFLENVCLTIHSGMGFRMWWCLTSWEEGQSKGRWQLHLTSWSSSNSRQMSSPAPSPTHPPFLCHRGQATSTARMMNSRCDRQTKLFVTIALSWVSNQREFLVKKVKKTYYFSQPTPMTMETRLRYLCLPNHSTFSFPVTPTTPEGAGIRGSCQGGFPCPLSSHHKTTPPRSVPYWGLDPLQGMLANAFLVKRLLSWNRRLLYLHSWM